jgi:predicted transcriptional regulator
MQFKKKIKTTDSSEALLKKAYTAKRIELQELLKIIEEKISVEGSNENLNRTKSVITTKLLLQK